MQIDIDQELANRAITRREKLAVWALLLIFTIVLPSKYPHQVKAFVEEIKSGMN